MKTLGIRLKELRVERGLYQSDIAEFLSVSLRQVQRYEKDESEMSLSTAISLAEFFNVSIDYLTGRSDQRNC
ncbi:helix-turn-helix domain-containing protein [Lederbergia lenta]|uniref:helix-turn-helix domain-containing protein n=1 Tax=Lederbergia lenta TaxID=1467 RepID=UPI00203DDA6A|nr:helix-turn-helix transcriptional regulator [Lederbergia lenta]MCM3113590.1 helix-turn-helix domain-containing protein [Lederbergia lenta]